MCIYVFYIAHSKSLVHFVNRERFSFLVTILGVYVPNYGQLYVSPGASVINRCLNPHNLVAVELPRPRRRRKKHVHTHIRYTTSLPFHRTNYLSIYLTSFMSHVRCAHDVHANAMINHQHTLLLTHTHTHAFSLSHISIEAQWIKLIELLQNVLHCKCDWCSDVFFSVVVFIVYLVLCSVQFVWSVVSV